MAETFYIGLEKPKDLNVFEQLAFELEEKTFYTASELKNLIFNFVSIQQGSQKSEETLSSEIRDLVSSCYEIDLDTTESSGVRSAAYAQLVISELGKSLTMKREEFRLKMDVARLSAEMPLPRKNRKNARDLARKNKKKN